VLYGANVTVIIPTIPPRRQMLRRAVHSVMSQTVMPGRISIEIDSQHEGSAATRNRALGSLTTDWVAFLDDDDVFLPDHLCALLLHAEDTGADVVYSWPEMNGGPDPSPDRFGVPFDPELLKVRSYIPVTSLVRTSAIFGADAEFRPWKGTPYDDWGFYCQLLEAGAKFSHRPERTWVWNIHGYNTSGRGDRW
jgi:glycosyltransferase involved in cell wall biosynthesis